MKWRVKPSVIQGTLSMPGDKSISHRALMIAALAEGESEIRGLPAGQDVRSTMTCLKAMDINFDGQDHAVVVRAPGYLSAPSEALEAGNSGTTMRLLSGMLAAHPFASCITGDASLRRRPMQRIIDPLSQMGARIESREGKAPLHIHGNQLRGISYTTPVPSAQVKSAILLAGLLAEDKTTVVEPAPTRDHTERLLEATGIKIRRSDRRAEIEGGQRPQAFRLTVPGDPSSAAFFQAAAALTGGEVTVIGVSLNPTRCGFLDALEQMGAEVKRELRRMELTEPVGDITVRGPIRELLQLRKLQVPGVIDEIPLLVLLATQASGVSVIEGAEELRHKESDRISGVTRQLRAMGADIEALPDGFRISGPTPLEGVAVASEGDHRLVMMLAVAGCVASGETIVSGAEHTPVSFPDFEACLGSVGGNIDVV